MHHRVKAIKSPKLSSLISALFADVLFSAAIYYFNLRIFRDICELSTSHDRPLKVSSQQNKAAQTIKAGLASWKKSREFIIFLVIFYTCAMCPLHDIDSSHSRSKVRPTCHFVAENFFHFSQFSSSLATCYVYRYLARKTDDVDGQRARSDEMKIYF